jgi:alpha-L-arabinofuranosidase
VAGSIETGRWYDIRVELKGSNIKCFLDGKLVHDVTPQSPQPLYASAGRRGKSGELILKVVNVSDQAQAVDLRLAGVRKLRRTGAATVLTSAGPLDENSLDAPTRIAPLRQTFPVAGPEFSRVFPPHSLSVIRLFPQK